MNKIYILGLFLGTLITLSCSKKITEVNSDNKRNLIEVTNSDELKNVLLIAKPGDSIVLKDGIYMGKFTIAATVSGTKKSPITISGSRNAILDAGSTETGFVMSFKANYWRIKGFTMRNGSKGLVIDGGNHNVIDGIFVTKIGEEAVHFRTFSSHNIIKNSEITYTGLKNPGYGEGVYIGTAVSNWPNISDGQPDKCDSNKVINNKIGPYIAAECVDIKEGTTGGIISGNTFDAQGITGANWGDSWIDVKGSYYVIENNVGNNSQPSVLKDGFEVNCAVNGWGNYNVFKNNICNVNAGGFGFNIKLKSNKGEAIGNKVHTSNKVINAVKGVSNIPLTND
jgi:hypothetical protein